MAHSQNRNALKHNVHLLHVSGATMHTIIAHKGIFNSIQQSQCK